jgi:Ca-activated chloride channel family protein
MRRVSITALLLLTLLLCPSVLPQDRRPGQISVDVNLVALPVSVTDKDGVVLEGLTEKNFQVLEDNVAQQISLFKHEDIPVSVGLVIDDSGSMRSKKEKVHSAALSFVKESNPDDETFVVAFEDVAYLQQDFTGSLGDIVDALDSLDPRLETALFDAVYLSVDHVKEGKLDKKALLVISDGEDNSSKWGYNKLLEHVQQAKDVTIYAIGIFDENDSRSGGLFSKSPQKKAKDALKEIAELTGGQAFFPKSIDEVLEICTRIAKEIRNQYTIGYNPKNTKQDGSWRKVTVNLVNPPKGAKQPRITTRQGYYAPGARQ